MAASKGFPPIESYDANILVLGSLPGQKSIAEQQYYAHPQNAFWRIMYEMFGVEGEYADRCRQLRQRKIALWDVLAASVRPGSLDARIQMSSARPNDFDVFLREHTQLRLIAFNGKKAEQLFRRFVNLPSKSTIQTVGLPSTSPAFASLAFSGKLQAWRAALSAVHG